MKDKLKGVLVTTGAIAALATGGVAIAGATGGDDDRGEKEIPIAGSALDRASQAALEEVGGGEVTGTEAGDEEGAYEVEVTRPDGSEVDIHLDDRFEVIGSETEAEDREDAGDDRDD